MTTPPYYTATAGPVDVNAGLRAKIYTVVSALLGLVTVASTFHLITTDQATALSNLGTSFTGLVGAAVTAFVAFKTNTQVKNGTFDAAPVLLEPVKQAPILDAFEAIGALKQHVEETVQSAQQSVQSAVASIQNAVQFIPGLGTVANNPLVDEFLKQEVTRP